MLFAILALSSGPDYLADSTVRLYGQAGIVAFFFALLAALLVVLPLPVAYQENNLTDMAKKYHGILRSKVWSLRIALGLFLVGMGCLLMVISGAITAGS